MRRKFLYWGLLLGLFLAFDCCYAYTFTVYEPPEINQEGYASYPKITKLEHIILNKTYENEDISDRLSRLEQKVCSKSYNGADLSWRVENITKKIDQSELYNISSKDLASIEKRVLGRSYKKDDLQNRLSRLECQIFGAAQAGKPDERYETILTASNHYTNFSNEISNPLAAVAGSNGPVGGIKNAFRNAFSTITSVGSMTGYTPPISPYGVNMPYGFDPRYGTYGPRNNFYGHNCPHRAPNIGFGPLRHSNSYPQHINRYYNYNNNFNTGMGVRILD